MANDDRTPSPRHDPVAVGASRRGPAAAPPARAASGPTAVIAAAAVVAVAAVVAYAWWAVGLAPFSWQATVAVVAAGVAAAVGSAWSGRRHRSSPAGGVTDRPPARDTTAPTQAPGLTRWAVLAVVAAAWQLAAYLQHPRDDHPTLSSLTNAALDSQPARAAAFVVWLVAAALLARMGRR
jgi:hypothetical protein